jgi:hypothetical protein
MKKPSRVAPAKAMRPASRAGRLGGLPLDGLGNRERSDAALQARLPCRLAVVNQPRRPSSTTVSARNCRGTQAEAPTWLASNLA